MIIEDEHYQKRRIKFTNALFLTHDAMMIANEYKLNGEAIVEEMMETNTKDELLKVFDKHFGEHVDIIA